MNRFSNAFALSVLAVSVGAATPVLAAQDPPQHKAAAGDLAGLHDFDFLVGAWRVHHRRLKERLDGNHDWVEFEGTCVMSKLMDGYGNVDDNVLNLPEGAYRAIGLRTYDPKTAQWSIWWVDGRMPSNPIDPAVKGGFANGVGTFETNDTLRGKPIRVRFTWSKITPTTAHWEQAFSPDGGKSWETNWTMEFERES